MKKSEIFALLTGLIGLAADVVTLCLFFSQRISGASAPSLASNIIIAGSIIYGWFIISWTLARRAWLRASKSKRLTSRYDRSEALGKKVAYTVVATGIILLPLQWLFLSVILPSSDPLFHGSPSETDKLQWFHFIAFLSIISLAAIGGLIFAAVGLLMPIIYEDMEELSDY
jgi:hypothetical protein